MHLPQMALVWSQSEPIEFDFSLIFWVLAFLLPVLALVGSFVFQLAAKLLGVELPQKTTEKPTGPGNPSPQETSTGTRQEPVGKGVGNESPAPDPNYPIFEEFAAEPMRESAPAARPVPAPQTVRAAKPQAKPQASPRPRPSTRTSIAVPLQSSSPPNLGTSLSKPARQVLPSLQSEFAHTTETPSSGAHLEVDPYLQPPTTLAEWRRAVLLQEILAPPLALRRDARPGEIHPFELG